MDEEAKAEQGGWGRFALRHPGLALAVVALTSLACLALLVAGQTIEGAPRLIVDTRLELLLPQRDERLADYREFSDAFGGDDRLAVALLETKADVFSEEFLLRVHRFSEALAADTLVEGGRLISLSHVTYTRSEGGWLDVAPLFRPGEQWDPAPIREALAGHPLYVDRVVGRGGDAVAFLIPLEPTADTPANRALLTARLEERFAAFAQEGERAWLDGVVVTRPRILRLVRSDMKRIFPAAALVLLLVTAVWFRDVRATLMTLGVVVGCVVWTLASMALLGIPLSLISASVIPVLLLVAGVGDSVHLISAYRRARREGLTAPQASGAAVDQTLGPCLLTSLTTGAGFLALLTSDVPLVAQLGLPLAIGVFLAFWITFLGLPPLLARGWVSEGSAKAAWGEAAASWIEARVVARPKLWVGGGLLAIAVCALGLTQLQVESRMLGDFDADHPLRATRAHFEQHLGGVSALEVYVRPAPGATWATGQAEGELPTRLLERDALEGIASLTSALRSPALREQGVLAVLSLSDFLIDMHYVLEERDPKARVLPKSKAAAAQFLLLYEGASPQDPTTDVLHPDRDRLRIQVRIRNLATPEFFALAEAVEAEARATPEGPRAGRDGEQLHDSSGPPVAYS
ncbi:MAG: MMPL family transporter [Planctomycetes bacterium]|nr:MMPL family transporter [Planctomycetota bacterium]